MALGIYPGSTLEAARRKAEEPREQIAKGIDPSEAQKQRKQARQIDIDNAKRKASGLPILNSFKHAVRDWLASIGHLTGATTHIKKISRLERLAFPVLGDMPIKAIKSEDVLKTLKPLIDKSQLETAHRLHSTSNLPANINDRIVAKTEHAVEIWQPEPGDSLIGILIGSEKAVGTYGENYQILIQNESGSIPAAWLTAWLKENLKVHGAEVGDLIAITFSGKKQSPAV